MANTFPVGHMRVNPTTFMTEVWDGKTWIDTVPQMITSNGNMSGTISASSYATPSNITTSSVKHTFSDSEKELMFEFLKENMRVAEYRDGNGKLENVELQLRFSAGYEWEAVRRTKIIRSKI